MYYFSRDFNLGKLVKLCYKENWVNLFLYKHSLSSNTAQHASNQDLFLCLKYSSFFFFLISGMDSIKRQHLKWALAPPLKEKQWLNAAKSVPFAQTSPGHLLLGFSYRNLFGLLLWLDGICINCTQNQLHSCNWLMLNSQDCEFSLSITDAQ